MFPYSLLRTSQLEAVDFTDFVEGLISRSLPVEAWGCARRWVIIKTLVRR